MTRDVSGFGMARAADLFEQATTGRFLRLHSLKTIDKLAGGLLTRALPRLRPAQVDPIAKILFIRPGGLGDALLLLPVIERFAEANPGAVIDILAESRNRSAFAFLTVPHRVELYTRPGAFLRLRNRAYDVVIDTEQWYHLSAVYARLLKPRRLIGFATNARKRLLTDPVAYRLNDYEVDSFFRLLEPLGLVAEPDQKVLHLKLADDVLDRAARLLDPQETARRIAIFPGASVPEKCWPSDYYRRLVAGLQAEGNTVVLVGGKTEGAVAADLAASTQCRDLTGKTTLAETAGVLAAMDLLITGDSALLHLAASLGTPTLSLFGPSSPIKWAPQGAEKHVCLQKECDCIPCAQYGHIPPCPYDVKCLGKLLPDEVLAAARGMLVNGKGRSR